MSLSVTSEALSFTDPRVGGLDGSDDDQGAQLEHLLKLMAAAQSDALGVLPPGRIVCDREITLTGDARNVRLVGAGMGERADTAITAIECQRDLGPGKHLLRLPKGGYAQQLENVALIGPGQSGPNGDLPAEMGGLWVANRALVQGVRVTGFAQGVGILNDHQAYRDCDFRGNGYGMNWLDQGDINDPDVSGLGDFLIDHCYLTDQSRASIGIADTNCVANARFSGNGHSGSAPFGVHRYRTGNYPRGTAMVGVVFQSWSWEAIGNACFYDEPNRTNDSPGAWTNIVFDSAGGAIFGGPTWPGQPVDLAVYDIGYAAGWHWRDTQIPDTMPPAATMRARSIRDLTSDLWSQNFQADVPDARLFALADYAGRSSNYISGVMLGQPAGATGRSAATAWQASEQVNHGELVELHKWGTARRWRGERDSLYQGVAAATYQPGEVAICHLTGGGSNVLVLNSSDTDIPERRLLRPHPDGGVQAALGPGSSPIVGVASDGPIPAGQLGKARLA